jgi:stage IV sporulation protein A
MIDCVGYMVDGVAGQGEQDAPRMVTTPWYDHEVPLAVAAETGTRKVMTEHSTVAVAITTDGSFTDIPRQSYEKAEERIIAELKEAKKPFGLVLNCKDPYSDDSQALRAKLEEKYSVPCVALNCQQMTDEDIENVLSAILYEFSIEEICFSLPEWLWGIQQDEQMSRGLYADILTSCEKADRMKDVGLLKAGEDMNVVSCMTVSSIDLGSGRVNAEIDVPRKLFYKMLSDSSGVEIDSEGQILPLICELSKTRREYERLESALAQVRQTGYGIVMPEPEELTFETSEIISQSGRYGVRLRATAPSIHLIRADIQTEVCP